MSGRYLVCRLCRGSVRVFGSWCGPQGPMAVVKAFGEGDFDAPLETFPAKKATAS
jgi:hypothetical protein